MLRQQNIEEFLESVARAERSVLLLDYDGTLAPFSVDRQRAVPYPGVRNLLQQIIDGGRTRLVIVTGRDAHEIDPFLRLRPAPEIWGSHGLQRLLPDGRSQMPEIPSETAEYRPATRNRIFAINKTTIWNKLRRNKCFRVEESVDTAVDAATSTCLL